MRRHVYIALLLITAFLAVEGSSAPRPKKGRAVPRTQAPPVDRSRVARPRITGAEMDPTDVNKKKRSTIGYAPGADAGGEGSTTSSSASSSTSGSGGASSSAATSLLGSLKALGGKGSGAGAGGGSGEGAGGAGAGSGGAATGGITYDDSQKKKGESADYGGGDKGGGDGVLENGPTPKVVAFQKWFPMCIFVEQGANGNAIVKGLVDAAADCKVNLVAFPFYINSNLPGDGQAAAKAAARSCNAVDGLRKYGATRASSLIVTKNKNLPASMCKSPAFKDKVGCSQLGWEPTPGQLFRQRGTGEDGGVATRGQTSVAMISTPNVEQAVKYGLGMAMMSRPPGTGAGYGVGDPDEGWASAGSTPERKWSASGCAAMRQAAFPNNGQWRYNPEQDKYLVDAGGANRLLDVVGGPQLFRPPKPPEKGGGGDGAGKGDGGGGQGTQVAGGGGGGGADAGGGGGAAVGDVATPGGGHKKPPGGGGGGGGGGSSAGAPVASSNGVRGSLRDQTGGSAYGPQPVAGGEGASAGGGTVAGALASGAGTGSNSGGPANSARIRYDDNARRGGSTTPLSPIGGASNAPTALLGSAANSGGTGGGASAGAADAFAATVGAGPGYGGAGGSSGSSLGGVRAPAGSLDLGFWSSLAGGRPEGAPREEKLRSRRDTGGVGYSRTGIYQ